MKLYIKNMVCDRCRMVVTNELIKLKIETKSVELGEVELADNTDSKLISEFGTSIGQFGFELIEDKTARIISQIKKAVVDFVHYPKAQDKVLKFSSYLSEFIGKDYNYLSGIFSDVEGLTIEQYLINQKIEKVKELLVYDELTLSEIADQLNYSSVQHLSTQFKKTTGLTPSHFKKIGVAKRLALDKV
jgi:AraC family transcriptional regulator